MEPQRRGTASKVEVPLIGGEAERARTVSQFLRPETVMTKGMAAEVRNEPENWSSCRR